MVEQSLEAYGYSMSDELCNVFINTEKLTTKYLMYTHLKYYWPKLGLLTGLPDAYGRGRIIGDYRRIALYGIDFLVEKKKEEYNNIKFPMMKIASEQGKKLKNRLKHYLT